jgi:hypothetical protein
MNPEEQRLQAAREGRTDWRRWGPYLSERQWGTVREDYSESGDAWSYFTHDQARSRAYRWGEDGLCGISDDKQRLCFALALWNGRDAILKERLFGLTNSEGNHGEDVKEHYYYLDSTPTHSYMKCLYKYPQAPYPYDDLVRTSHTRTRLDMEYELIDTGAFADDRYFDVFVEYAKEEPEDILIKISVHNRGPSRAALHVLPTLWFRNTWSGARPTPRPEMKAGPTGKGRTLITAQHADLGTRYLYCEGSVPLLFTENETNHQRIFGTPNRTAYVKDAIHRCVVHGDLEAVNPRRVGTKASAYCRIVLDSGENAVIRLRLCATAPSALKGHYPAGNPFGKHFDEVFAARLAEAEAFYATVVPAAVGPDAANVMRQALAGMLWTKQYYHFDAERWLEEHGADPLRGPPGRAVRNRDWFHMVSDDIISMPDKWEYPWYAAWDLAFHTVTLAMVDLDFAKGQLDLLLRELYLHPSGQLPAYEWNFSDVSPPVHAWATLFLYETEKEIRGKGDIEFLERAFQKLLVNFTWWVNRKDRTGRNVFEGGFLGLDNIGVFDRSAPLPTGGFLEQADGTAWMALFSQNMLEIALELASHDRVYEDMALKFLEHFLWIASAMDRIGEHQEAMWDEEDGFFYDVLRFPDGNAMRLKVRSLVGILPLCAATVFPGELLQRFPRLLERARRRLERQPHLRETVAFLDQQGVGGRRILSVLDEKKLRRVLAKLLDENEFLSPYGVRSLSRYHAEHPYVFSVHGEQFRVDYLPAESNTGMFGGNTNWRGPIWFPINALVIRALLHYYLFLGNDFTVECPTGSGRQMNLFQVAQNLSLRLARIFMRDAGGERAVYGGAEKLQNDPHFRDYVLFYEYFHGDNGAGLGASHQTGWTGIVARIIQMTGFMTAEDYLKGGRRATINFGR